MGCKVITVPLGDLVTMTSGGTPNKEKIEFWNGSIPWVSAKTLRGDCITNSDLYISELGLESSATKIAPKGSLLLLTRGSGLFKRIPLAIVGKPVAYNQDIKCISSKMSAISNRYLFYALKALEPSISGMLETTGIGAGKLSTDLLEQLSVPILEEGLRDRVVSFLDTLTSKIAINERINGYLTELVSLEFMSRFSENVPTVELGQVLSISTKSLKPQDCLGEVWEHYSIPAYDEKHWPVFEPADGIKSNKYIVDKDCILISKLNPTTKRIWMPTCSSNHPVCSTEFIVYKPNEPKHKSFYYAAIDAPAFTDFLLAHVTGSTSSRQRTQPKATLVYPMPAPGTEAIEDFCAFADPIYEQIKANELESKQLEELRDVLLPRLMSGKIDVSKVDLTQLNSHLDEC